MRLAGFASLVAGASSLAVSQYVASQKRSERRRRLATALRAIDRLDAKTQARILGRELADRGIGSANARTISIALVSDAASSLSTAAAAIGAILERPSDGNWRGAALRQIALVLAAAAVTPTQPPDIRRAGSY